MSEMIQVPDGWEVKALNNYTKLITKGTTPTTYGFNFHDNGINFIKAESIDEFGNIDVAGIQFIDEETNHFLKRSQLKQGDLLFSIAGVLGRVTILKKEDLPANTNQALAIIRLKENSERYLYYFLQSQFILSQIKSLNVQMAQANLSLENLNNFQIIIPKEKKEQEKIAKILSTLDKAIEATNRLIEKEKNIKKALMQELLTNGIDKDGYIRSPQTHTYKESELGLIPDEWEVVSLDKCSTITNSNVDKKSSVEEQEIKLCNYMDVYVNDEIDNSIDFMVATATELEIKKFTLKKDDVIITKDSESPDDIGIPSYVAEDLKDVICGYHLTMIRPKKNCYGKYLALLLQGNYYKKYFGKLASGSTRFALSLGTISQALITLPSITEQKQIAKILTTQDKKIETEETNLAKLKELKKGLMNDLLSGKVRVKSA
jgi:type I restriction enzyme S subunit